MKKQVKKLVLAKETLRGLGGADLRVVAGGMTWEDCPSTPINICQEEYSRGDC